MPTREYGYGEYCGLDQVFGYDFAAALSYSELGHRLEQVKRIAYEITGQADGCEWHWLVEHHDGTWAYVHGGCDYTGWDCRSHCDYLGARTLEGALAEVNESERCIFEDMISKGESVRDNPSQW